MFTFLLALALATTTMLPGQEIRSGPDGCVTEDTYWYRSWSGTLNGEYVVEVPTCSSPGGEGIFYGASGRGTWRLEAISPSGVVRAAHVIDGKGPWYSQAGCVNPPAFSGTVIIGTIEPGVWRIRLAGTSRNIGNLAVEVSLAGRWWQDRCPAADRTP